MSVKVINSRCPENHPCPALRRCPVGAIQQRGFDAPTIDNDKCIDCGKCTSFCPMGALVLEKRSDSQQKTQQKAKKATLWFTV